MSQLHYHSIWQGLKNGDIIPYLGPNSLKGSVHKETGEKIPADSDSLIIAMNNGRPMAPRLMYEFPRAAMNIELKRGRSAITRFLNETYNDDGWSTPAIHTILSQLMPKYIIDSNRDIILQRFYQQQPHILIRGIARLTASNYRFVIHMYDGDHYRTITQEQVDTTLPVLFKPLGSPIPDPTYIASDADYVDYITELMGGFAIPDFLKSYRKQKKYLFLGLPMNRDTERMLLSDITYGSHTHKGWAIFNHASEKEKRFCKKQGIDVIEMPLKEFINQLNIHDMALQPI